MMSAKIKKVLLVVHPTRQDASEFGVEITGALKSSGFDAFTNHSNLIPNAIAFDATNTAHDIDIALVLGGDGTILRAAELVRGRNVPIIGINMGSVGFLAEINRPSPHEIVEAFKNGELNGEDRLLLNYEVVRNEEVVSSGWALNELTIERSGTQMVELFVQIDDRPLSRWGCDGVICATPTGSTAYAFSAGGPVIWPSVSAFLLLPLAAHALFAKPMVISPNSRIGIDIESVTAEISADGMRKFALIQGDRINIARDSQTMKIVHIDNGIFTDRLVAKFKLPVEGWRGQSS
jgi:NAD+ kinase